MNVTVSKKDLLQLVTRCLGVVDKKSTMPVLANVLLSASEGNSLRVSATDLYLAFSDFVEAEVSESGSVAVPAKDLYDRVRVMPEGSVRIEADENSIVKFQSTSTPRRYRLHGVPDDSFPSLPTASEDAPKLELRTDLLSMLFGRTQFSISTSENRPHVNSALLEWEGDQVRVVTTDGHRLTKMEVTADGQKAQATILIPAKGVAELRKLADDYKSTNETVVISQWGPNAFFTFGRATFSAKLVEAEFPAYQQVIPHSSDHVVQIPRIAWMEALRAMSLSVNDRTGGLRLDIESGTMRITSESPERGDGFDEIPVDYDGPELQIGFNAKYILDVLAVLDEEEVLLALSGELDPAVIRPASEKPSQSFLAVVMPLRI